MKISVIVPVYNVEDYIQECINSILKQSFTEYEVILVDDGSQDKSISLIKNIIDSNENIKLITKKNGGLSSARNYGLKVARGEYVIFIDSDDFIEEHFLENLYLTAKENNLDVALGGYKKLYRNKTLKVIDRVSDLYNLGVVTGKEFLYNELILNDYRMEVWCNLYKREFLMENNLKFIEGILHEDEEFTPKMMVLANRVKLTNEIGYIYRQRQGSIMATLPKPIHVDSLFSIVEKNKKLFYKATDERDKILYSRLTRHLTGCIESKVIVVDQKFQKEILLRLKDAKLIKILKYKKGLSLKSYLKFQSLKITPKIYINYFKNKIS